jgi:hypothetical protein
VWEGEGAASCGHATWGHVCHMLAMQEVARAWVASLGLVRALRGVVGEDAEGTLEMHGVQGPVGPAMPWPALVLR